MAYPRVYEESKALIHQDEMNREVKSEDGRIPDITPLFVEALTKKNDESAPVNLVAERILTLDEVVSRYSLELHVHLFEGSEDEEKLPALIKLLKKHPGKISLILCVKALNGYSIFIEASQKFHVTVTRELLTGLTHLLGENRFRIKPDDTVPQPRPKYQKPAWKQEENGG